MSGRRGRPAVVGVLLAAALGAAPLAGQSLLAAGGLGATMDPVDGRGRALGAVGPGLFGTAVVPGDPGASLDLTIPTIAFSFESSWLSIDQAGVTGDNQGSRVPALGIAYPVRRWGILTVTYGGVLDQRWTLERDHTLPLNQGGADVEVRDRFVSDGGVAAMRVGFSRRLIPQIGVAAAVGTLTGSVVRTYSRSFDTLTAPVPVKPFTSGGKWGYSGVTATAGVVFDFARVARAAGSVTWSGALEAEPLDGNESPGKSYDMPVQVRGGVSGTLATGLTAVVSGSWADWSATTDDLDDAAVPSGSAVTLGAGLEWERMSFLGRPMPLRFGWHRAELPFAFDDEKAIESSLVGGAGLALVRAGTLPLAQIDLAVERGSRTSGSVTEDYWRSTVSLRLAGF